MISVSEWDPWYAIRVRSRHEKVVAAALCGKGYSTFLPLYASQRRSSGPLPSRLPFFPGYVFCRFEREKLLPVVTTPGVVGVVNDGRYPIAVDSNEIESIRKLVLSGLPPQASTYIAEGELIRVDAGPLRGVEGIYLQDKNGSGVVVSIGLLQRSLKVEVPREFVVPLRRATCAPNGYACSA